MNLQTADLTENFDLSTMTTTKPAVGGRGGCSLRRHAGHVTAEVTGDLRCFHVLQVFSNNRKSLLYFHNSNNDSIC